MNIHHIGIITDDLEASAAMYESLGGRGLYVRESDIIRDDIQHNDILFLKNTSSGERIELIAPYCEKSSVNTAKRGLAHICYEVPNLDDAVLEISRQKLGKAFTKTLCAPALNNRRIIFLFMKDKTVIELVEK